MGRFNTRFGEVFVVADGMGGMEGGGIAASIVVTHLKEHIDAAPSHLAAKAAFHQAILQVHGDIGRAAAFRGRDVMGAAVVVALVSEDHVLIAHSGDSRAYLHRGGKLTRLTKDHSLVQKMIDHGMLTEEEARVHPNSNIVTRALGLPNAFEPDFSDPIPLLEGDAILLCSDGLCRCLDDRSIGQLLRPERDADSIARDLLDESLAAGADDNITLQFVRFSPEEPVTIAANQQKVMLLTTLIFFFAILLIALMRQGGRL